MNLVLRLMALACACAAPAPAAPAPGPVPRCPLRPASALLVSPPELADRAAVYFDLTVTGPESLLVGLYDAERSPMATVLLEEDAARGTMVGSVRPVGEPETWIRVERRQEGATVTVEATSSDAASLEVRATTGPPLEGKGMAPVVELSIEDSDGRIVIPAERTLAESYLVRAVEQRALFATAPRQLLWAVLRNVEAMIDRAAGGRGEVPGASGGCSVLCIRVAETIPVYACDGGWAGGSECSAGDGLFVITSGCGYFSCFLPCERFRFDHARRARRAAPLISDPRLFTEYLHPLGAFRLD